MKKLSIVGIVVVILSIMMCCVSHAQTNTEITFRNVPWGQTFDETAADTSLDDETRTLFYNVRRTYDVTDDYYLNLIDSAGYEEGMSVFVRGSYDLNLPIWRIYRWNASITVAGKHKTSYIKLRYMHSPEGDLKFFGATYCFEDQTMDDVKDFEIKLASLYGEPDEVYERSHHNNITGEDTEYIGMHWIDEYNNSLDISATIDDSGLGVGDIYIFYESGQTCNWAIDIGDYYTNSTNGL